jgi:hypothetical protein
MRLGKIIGFTRVEVFAIALVAAAVAMTYWPAPGDAIRQQRREAHAACMAGPPPMPAGSLTHEQLDAYERELDRVLAACRFALDPTP